MKNILTENNFRYLQKCFENACMKRTPHFLLLLIISGFVISSVSAQNLESIGKEKPLSVTGGVSLNQIFYGVSGIESRRDPYSYYASGNINFSLYGWSVPLSFSVSNQNTSFSQPFNQYSLHPTYKSVTAHIGYTSMSFSPYTVSGHIFLGGGVDVAPEGKWKFSGLYGRFLKAVEPDTTRENAATPAFQRYGYGAKVTYGDGGNFVDIIMFHAKDDLHSIHYVPDSLDILPQENLVLSLGAGKTILKHFILKGEFASSAITRDTRAAGAYHSNLLANTRFLYTSRISSSYYNAMKASFDFQQDTYSVGVAYERIDPQYRTLGAYYFNNDLENITLNAASTLAQGKVNVAVSGGTQHDNLDKSKVSTMRRLVGSVNVNYTPSQKLNFAGSYSSFQTFTNIRSQFQNINQVTPYDNLDTLNFTQISRNATLTTMYSFGTTEKRKQNININLTWQDAADKQGEITQNSGTQFYNFNTGYALNIVPQNMTLSLSFNASINEGAGFNTKTMGPTAAINRSFFERKLRATVSSSYNNTYNDGQKINTIVNGRLNGSYTVQKKHNINVSIAVIKREAQGESTTRAFTEFTGTLGYSYTFGTR
jgi:hypothetical protein